MTYILGISAYYHDSAACLVLDGKILAAAQEERFSRKKHDPGFPEQAILYCLEEASIDLAAVDSVVFYDKPILKFERLLETYLSNMPHGFLSFTKAIPVWLKEKLFLKKVLKQELSVISGISVQQLPELLFNQHHRSHAASAFYPSPFQEAVVICLDGVGEWATTSVWLGRNESLKPLWEIDFPHSLGLLYSAFTYYCGFKVNSGEYKLMGLAPYGEPIYAELILEHLIQMKADGSFQLDMTYFNYPVGLTMTAKKFHTLFGAKPRKPESTIDQKIMDIAASVQHVTECVILNLLNAVYKEIKIENLCLAGGVALNCVANGKIIRQSPFKHLWVQPAAGDAGGALGAAMTVWHEFLSKPRQSSTSDAMQGAYLGPAFSNQKIKQFLDQKQIPYQQLDDAELMPHLAELMDQGNVLGWFNGRMEFGPRSLGARSIIGDARNRKMQSQMNLKIKYRESFRPFAPAVKADKVSEWFEIDQPSPYMLLVADVVHHKLLDLTEADACFGIEKLNQIRSEIPAVTHVDNSARIQTVHTSTNSRFYALLDAFEKLTGCPVLVNTSFNVRGEPIVQSPEDAYRCFMCTEMDYLVLENCLLSKQQQPEYKERIYWKNDYVLD